MSHHVVVYPDFDPIGPSVPWSEIFEVTEDATGDVVHSDAGVRHHPEVPLTPEERDAVLATLRYRRTGPWKSDDDRHEAPVTSVDEETL
ncbi:hypothetical protein [Streptomyces achromogenes]|uniref:hypothetical protein n=1 Tax=Streptomyces achromogenes TaxID=67255 RepID=UPI003A80F1E1